MEHRYRYKCGQPKERGKVKRRTPVRSPSSARARIRSSRDCVFSDFQCPFCAAFNDIAEDYLNENNSQVLLAFRNSPLPIHDWAKSAALAGVCVNEQSTKSFWRLNDLLFSQQKAIKADSLDQRIDAFLKNEPDLKPDEFKKCMASQVAKNKLERDLAEAQEHDIHATPTVFINGRRYNGFRDRDAFSAAVKLAIQEKSDKGAPK